MSAAERLEALAQAVRAGRDALPEDVVARARAVEDRAGHRLRLSPDHTVVALAGSTGSGKSSLLNALAGDDLAAVDVIRPTTSEALAAVRGEDGSGPLLDWLGVRRRHVLPPAPASTASDGGLVLLDLPDHDSVRTEHRLEAERLVGLVDLMVWVVDPQKYADAAVHERYLRGLATHADVVRVVLNQVDRLTPDQLEACRADLARLLAEDGLPRVPLLAVSARTGEGVDELRAALDDAARRRRAVQDRVVADVTAVAEDVLAHCADGDLRRTAGADQDDRGARVELLEALEQAAGVPAVVEAVRRARVLRARRATGWPPTRWLARFRPDPLRRMHLGGDEDADVSRTSLPPPGPAERARARGAVRAYADAVTAGAGEAWVLAARRAVEPHEERLADRLDRAVAGAPLLPARRPVWWGVVGALQWLLVAALVLGLLWLGALAGLDALRLPTPEPPRWGEVPWPTLLALGGAVAGLVVAGVARVAAGVGGRAAARRATTHLRRAVGQVTAEEVVVPVSQVLDRRRECRDAALVAAGRGGRR